MVTSLGNNERAAMYLELERVAKELKEQEWQLRQVQKIISELGMYAKEDFPDKMLERLGNPDTEALNRQALVSLLRKVLSLREEKADLEKRLGMKISFE
jgi:hypothetical protein